MSAIRGFPSECWVSIRTPLIGYTFQGMSKSATAVDLKTPISTMRERLTGMLTDWGADFSTLLKDLEHKRALLQAIEAEAANKSHEIETIHKHEIETIDKRVKAQDTLIKTLKNDAEETVALRKEVRNKDRELEKKKSEIDSKHVLIDALRRDIKEVKQLKGAIKTKEKENTRLVREKEQAEKRAEKLTEEMKILNASALMGIDATTELEAVRAELDVRKALIESLRGDAERAQALETQLEEKRDVVSKLEASVDRHVSALAESQQSVAAWKGKYASLKSGTSASESTLVRELTDEELQSQERAEDFSEDLTDATTPHDMRKSLLET